MRLRAVDIVDVFVYLVVLGLFTQFLPNVITESFIVSLATAVLFKLALEVIAMLKTRILDQVRASRTVAGKMLNGALLIVLGAGSKFVILWLTDLVFGDAVQLGGFFSVTLLIVVLMVSRLGIRLLIDRTWPRDGTA
ncbi:hypothetical protein DCE93_02810 [Agromyces badenianii]|uniref:Uncharacterized protein n=1 Tax=Agromyces badenianii TaxID=2080742 RepID=A0A2S0WZH1_9MICO|nr:hypothetical protein [Agromyces badenianii]AWB96759.1 hypothetical protein DCE93_02810 [Agromyces badenianii]PWC03750.1 hypothetical protein DCE94_10610 [Agromyces badenianii]